MIFHSVSSSDFPCSNLTGNNCTYCGGSIEDNYPPAGELNHQDHPLYHAFISAGDQDSPVYQSSFTKRNIVFKLSLFSDCRGGPLLPLWHHRLLHAQRETMRQVQSKFLLKKQHIKMHSTVTMNINTRLWRRTNASSQVQSNLERRQTNQLTHMSAPGKGNDESNAKVVFSSFYLLSSETYLPWPI